MHIYETLMLPVILCGDEKSSTERHARVVSTPASYLESPGLKP
jgi:hypothetical protein